MASKATKRQTNHAKGAAGPKTGSGAARRLFPLLALILLLAGAAVYLLVNQPGEAEEPIAEPIAGSPPVVFEPARFDFGEMPVNTKRSEKVVMRNTGRGPLQLRTARPSCACVKVDLVPVTIQPGSGVEVPVEMNSLSRPGQGTYRVNFMFAGYEQPAVLLVERTAVE